ncbi:MAG: HAD family hydrolase [Balneolia bacterium]|nr:HAD family hydrolase [Balneolia bacterium]
MKSTSFVSIDFWNTIVIAETNGEKRAAKRIDALKSLADTHSQTITDSQIREAHAFASKKFDEIWFGKSRTPDSLELVGFTLESLALSVSETEQKELARVYEDSLLDGPPELAPGVKETVEALSKKYKLGIISDTMFSPGRVLKDYLDTKGLGQFFTAFAFSNEVGVSKPHPDMYQKILDDTSTGRDGSFHIGDIQPTDIKGAQSFGIKGILYTGISRTYENDNTADFVSSDWDSIGNILLD